MQPTQEYIRRLQHKRNAGTENCMLSSDLAREMGITALDLHHYLIDVGFLYRERNTYELKALQTLCRAWIRKDSKPLPLQLEGRPRRDSLPGVDREGAGIYKETD